MSYGLAVAKRERGVYSNPFKFDQRHTLNIVLDYRIASWFQAGVRFHYGSGFPYTEPTGIKPRIVTVQQNGQEVHRIQTTPDEQVIFDIDRGGEGNRYQAWLPPYHRLDVRLTAYADYWGLDWSFYLDVINVYNRDNILTYRFFITDDLRLGRNATSMLPLLPTLGVAVRF